MRKFEVDKFERFAATMLTIVVIAVLMTTHTIDHEDGLAMLIYLTGYTLGGQFGPSVKRRDPPPP
jgi:hypothetical protein